MQLVKYKTGLSDDEAIRTIADRAPQYEALPGLRQKLYIRDASRVEGEPRVEVFEVVSVLRPERGVAPAS